MEYYIQAAPGVYISHVKCDLVGNIETVTLTTELTKRLMFSQRGDLVNKIQHLLPKAEVVGIPDFDNDEDVLNYLKINLGTQYSAVGVLRALFESKGLTKSLAHLNKWDDA